MTYYTTISSPIGPLVALSDGKNLIGLWMDATVRGDWIESPDVPPLPDTAVQLEEYFAGRRQAFTLPLSLEGTPFQRQVWQELLRIPYGETRSYGELARSLSMPNGSRAVGHANGQNPIAIIVPCHRVIGSNGKLTGYAGGLDRKHLLLTLESGF